MTKYDRDSRAFSSGRGFSIASLIGLVGVVAGTILWSAGAPLLLVFLVYFSVPGAMILALYLLWIRSE